MVVVGGQRRSQLSNSVVVEPDGHEVVYRFTVTDGTDADNTGQGQSAGGRADLTHQGRRITLGHQPLRFLEQQRHPLCSGLGRYAVSGCARGHIGRL